MCRRVRQPAPVWLASNARSDSGPVSGTSNTGQPLGAFAAATRRKRVHSDDVSAAELEKHIDSRRKGDGRRHKNNTSAKLVRFRTSVATVTVTFRRTTWTDANIAAAMNEARAKVGNLEPGIAR